VGRRAAGQGDRGPAAGVPDQLLRPVGSSRVGAVQDPRQAVSLARSFRHFWSGDYQSCVHLVVPKIEAAARALLLALDEGIYRAQVAKEPGQYPGLYMLILELEKLGLDESWAYFLNWLLLGPAGMNIRNEIAHGFVGEISPTYAGLTLRAAAMLITVVPPRPPSATSSADTINQSAKDVTELPRPDPDDILQTLRRPVRDPVPLPGREGAGGRLAALGAGVLRITATTLQQIARQLDQ
jgi:Domain of unknown function (DUF4209)